MKTEKEFSDYFLSSTGLQFPVHSVDDVYLQTLAENYWSDLTSHLTFYFSNENRLKMTEAAATKFAALVKIKILDEAWKDVLRDFNQNRHWGYAHTLERPKSLKTEEQKIFWKLFGYAWAFFQSMVVLKIAVYYFGLESAQHPDQTNVVWVWIFFGLSFFSLVFFAYRNRKDKD